MSRFAFSLLSALLPLGLAAQTAPAAPSAAEPSEEKPAGRAPNFADVAYGSHERQRLNVWLADSVRPTAVVIQMHGGGWTGGDRRKTADKSFERLLASGISCVSISYRYVQQARDAKVTPPVEWPMNDAARVLQFVRSKAAEWNINKNRIAFTGESAGACSSLWLAFHDDMADPKAADPVARESTRLSCVAVKNAQTSLDPAQMKAWTPNSIYGYHAFGFNAGGKYEARVAAFAKFVENRDSVLKWIREYSPYEQATKDDPAVYLYYDNKPALGQPQKDPTHTANFGVKLKEHLDALGVPCELAYPGAPAHEHDSIESYLIAALLAR